MSLSHPLGRAKAHFFRGLGFDDNSESLLEAELIHLARKGEAVQCIPGQYGTKYIVKGRISTPNGVQVAVVTVWLIEPNDPRPRLVTAYPEWSEKKLDDS